MNYGILSEIHSSSEKDFTSINDITFSAMKRATALFGKATFVMNRGYDDNKMFLKLDSRGGAGLYHPSGCKA